MNFRYFLSRIWLIVLCCACTCAVQGILFPDLFIPFTYLIPGVLIIIAFVFFYRFLVKRMTNASERNMVRTLFLFSFVIRLLSVLGLYFAFFHITGTPQHPDAVDAFYYHNMGIDISEEIHRGIFDPLSYAVGYFKFDDIGYGTLIGILYAIFGPYHLVVRIFHAIIGAWTVVFGYKILKNVWNKDIAIKGALLLSLFPSTVYLTGIHNKETVMIFFTFMFLYAANNIFTTRRFGLSNGVMVFLSIAATIFLRLPLAILMILTVLSALLFQSMSFGRLKAGVFMVIIMVFLMIVTQYVGVYSEGIERAQGYIKISEGGQLTVKGRSVELYVERGQRYAKYLTKPIGLIISLITPFPSIVKTNLRFYNQCEHWWHLSGLFIWGTLSYFSILGFIHLIRHKFSECYIISALIAGYLCMISLSNYTFSIRYNMIKVPLMLLLAVPGIVYSKISLVKKWNVFLIFLYIVILLWNYIKISGRGLI